MSTGTSFVDSIVRTKNVFVDVDGKNCNDKSSSRRRGFTSPYYFYVLVLVLMMIMSLSYINTIIRIIFFGDDNDDEVGSYESQPTTTVSSSSTGSGGSNLGLGGVVISNDEDNKEFRRMSILLSHQIQLQTEFQKLIHENQYPSAAGCGTRRILIHNKPIIRNHMMVLH